MWRPEYYVRLVSLPGSVEGVSLPNSDGSFDIYINETLSPSRREKTLRHELNHIFHDHFYRDDLAVGEIEAAADTGMPVGMSPAKSAAPASPAHTARRRYIREFDSLEALLIFALKNGGL